MFGVAVPGIVHSQDSQGYETVTEERLETPETANWLSYRGNYAGWGYSGLDQIDVSNVGDLAPVWSFSTGVGSGHEAPPIVNDGMMFVTTPQNQLLALDAASGDLVWLYRHELPEDLGRLPQHEPGCRALRRPRLHGHTGRAGPRF